ncbi:MAG TPA: hypothetical protein VK211_10350 [Kamptonema sp.]|nr:hypothetical protein [Kamptonema sp.]
MLMKFNLSISTKAVTHILIRVIIGLTLLSFLGQLMVYFLPENQLTTYFAKAFNVDLERNIPTLYSCFGLLFSSMLLGAIAYGKKLENNRYTRHWMILSGILFYQCLDEGAQLHEKLIMPLRTLFQASGFLYFTWVVPAFVLLALFGLFYLKFINHFPIKFRNLFIMAGLVYIGGALGMELLGGHYASVNGMDNIGYQVFVTIEEFLEMLGIVIFINALQSYIIFSFKDLIVEVRLEDFPQIVEEKISNRTLTPEIHTQDLS